MTEQRCNDLIWRAKMTEQERNVLVGRAMFLQAGWDISGTPGGFPAILDDGTKVMLTKGEGSFCLAGVPVELQCATRFIDRALQWADDECSRLLNDLDSDN